MISFPEIETGKGPILMLNMLKFKDRRLYFQEYLPAFKKVVKQLGITGIKITAISNVEANIIAGDDDAWDAILLVEYPSAEAFKEVAFSAVYHEIAEPLRAAATEKLKLFMTRSANDMALS